MYAINACGSVSFNLSTADELVYEHAALKVAQAPINNTWYLLIPSSGVECKVVVRDGKLHHRAYRSLSREGSRAAGMQSTETDVQFLLEIAKVW